MILKTQKKAGLKPLGRPRLDAKVRRVPLGISIPEKLILKIKKSAANTRSVSHWAEKAFNYALKKGI